MLGRIYILYVIINPGTLDHKLCLLSKTSDILNNYSPGRDLGWSLLTSFRTISGIRELLGSFEWSSSEKQMP